MSSAFAVFVLIASSNTDAGAITPGSAPLRVRSAKPAPQRLGAASCAAPARTTRAASRGGPRRAPAPHAGGPGQFRCGSRIRAPFIEKRRADPRSTIAIGRIPSSLRIRMRRPPPAGKGPGDRSGGSTRRRRAAIARDAALPGRDRRWRSLPRRSGQRPCASPGPPGATDSPVVACSPDSEGAGAPVSDFRLSFSSFFFCLASSRCCFANA